MNQPVYRGRVTSEEVTEVGVGVAVDEATRRMWVTITYVLLPPPIDPEVVARSLPKAVNVLEDGETSPELSEIARHYASGLALGWRPEHLWPRIHGELSMNF